MPAKSNREDFITKSKLIHGNKYDYSLVEYVNNHTKVKIICPIHGVFEQKPNKHLSGHNCPNCNKTKKITQEEFIRRAKEKHGDKYDYSLVEYKRSTDKVKIICPRHGVFEQIANSHLQGEGCARCGKRPFTTEQFIEKAKKIHGDKYDYSITNYINTRTKIKIICPEHGIFEQTPKCHLKYGCAKCAGVFKLTKEEILKKFKEIHGDKYIYPDLSFKNTNTKIKIICPEHGEFERNISYHLKGHGCPVCIKKEKAQNFKSKYGKIFFEKAKEISPEYDFSKAEYINSYTKVKIICPKHGEFWQTPSCIINDSKCPKCVREASSINQTLGTEEFIIRAKEIHGNKYDYSLVDYKNNHDTIKIICPIHGVFEQIPNNHLRGSGCLECFKISKRKKSEDFIKESKIIHKNKYDYSLVDYVNRRTKVKIICPKHGLFVQNPGHHLSGVGCPKCSSSRGEIEIRNFLKQNNILFEEQKRFPDCKDKKMLPFDFYLPEKNLLIEFQGIQHYKPIKAFRGQEGLITVQRHDKIKKEYAKNKNINFLEIKYSDDLQEMLKLI